MFLARLLDRAAGTLPTLRNVGSLAQELDDPAWGPAPGPDPQDPEADDPPAARAPGRAARRAAPAAPPPDAPPTTQDTAPARRAPPPAAETPGTPPPAPARTTVSPAGKTPAAPARPAGDATGLPRRETVERRIVEPVTTAATGSETRAPVPPAPPPARPAPPAAATPRRDPPPEPRDDRVEVHLEIGRIDLVAAPPAGPAQTGPARRGRPGPNLTLSDYLSARRGDRP